MSKSSLIIGIALSLLFLYLYDTGRWPAMVAAFETGAMPPASTETTAAGGASGAQKTAGGGRSSGGLLGTLGWALPQVNAALGGVKTAVDTFKGIFGIK